MSVGNLSTGEAKAAESQVQGQPGLFSKCEASLGYVGPCLTTTKVHQGERQWTETNYLSLIQTNPKRGGL